ncbi:hypothetical protein [Jatrophihabitans endophyticus]|uniref:hypothetical protein n=1 Tax=Jatrophihabitans endophyticus TaxID=1206085 RepID=UPI0019E0EFEE|nr:hypothetical protein [Jatrophihabitans endophyticus]MBE7186677.1 hypothetical protein [Jatrophihabitans endophyticus]
MRTNRVSLIFAAALCVAVAAIHVDDQGGVTAFDDPDWLGWAYRLLEVGSVVVAGALVFAAGAAVVGTRAALVRVAAVLVGAGPFVGYVLTRTTGLPGDPDDVGNWGDTLGTVSLVVEGVLVLTAVAGLLARNAVRPEPAARSRVVAA